MICLLKNGWFYSLLIAMVLCLSISDGKAQTTKLKLKDRFSTRGYIKDMRIVSIAQDSNNHAQTLQQNLLHHRWNSRYQIDSNWQFGLELRNRVFYGEFLKYAPGYGDALELDPGVVDMQWSWINAPNLVAHTAIDRLWLNYSSKKWDVRLGRQRINWGQNIVWNPNDLFNVLNFADFDYEERPGSDAFKAQRYFKKNRSLQVAYKFTGDKREEVYAAMYRFIKKNYDFQVLTGKYHDDLAVGVGWAGNIKMSGFKGESTWFQPLNDSSMQAVLTSISWDMSYGNGMYVLVSGLHNSAGEGDLTKMLTLSGAQGGRLDLKSLMPNKYSVLVQASGAINPLLNANMAAIVAIDLGGMFIMPTIGYSVRQNLDLSLVGQSFVGLVNDDVSWLSNAIFLRFKWSY